MKYLYQASLIKIFGAYHLRYLQSKTLFRTKRHLLTNHLLSNTRVSGIQPSSVRLKLKAQLFKTNFIISKTS